MTGMQEISPTGGEGRSEPLNAAEIGAIAHLYRAEVYRSTTWRTRLDTSTNWAVVTLGIALSIAFASPGASPLPLVLVGVLIIFFLMLEARRYRHFNVWRARTRWMETRFYAPLLDGKELHLDTDWHDVLANDYVAPKFHVTLLEAVGRRIRSNYLWILLIQTLAYVGKLMVHPYPVLDVHTFVLRADIGPVPGEMVLAIGASYVVCWTGIALWSLRHDRLRRMKHDKSVPLSFG
jgi:uncharacterized membrane protein